MRYIVLGVVLACLCVAPVRAEEVTETWRSPFGTPTSVAVDPADGSVWVTAGASLMHLSSAGETLLQMNGFFAPQSVTVNPVDGSVWLVDAGALDASGTTLIGAAVLHVSNTGSVLWEGTSFTWPWAVALNPTDGSVWVADAAGTVSHLTAAGAPIWTGLSFETPVAVAVNPMDGSCWVTDEGTYNSTLDTYEGSTVVHLSAAGSELWRSPLSVFNAPESVAVNAADGSVWVADTYNAAVRHISASGQALWTGTDFSGPCAVAVNQGDGSVWVADISYGEVSHWSAAGQLLWRGDPTQGFWSPYAVAVSPADGSCWVGDPGSGEVVHVTTTGGIVWRQGGLVMPESIAEDWLDLSLWVPEGTDVVHLAGDGSELSRSSGFGYAVAVSVNLADGSCWVADEGAYDPDTDTYENGSVVHLAADGAQLWRGTFKTPAAVSVDLNDGSCWVMDWGTYNSQSDTYSNPAVVHLSASGAEIARSTAVSTPRGIAANSTDGGCWVADTPDSGGLLRRFDANAQEVWHSTAFAAPVGVAADPGDGSVWVGDVGQNAGSVVHLAANGQEVGRSNGYTYPGVLSANPMDGSCWVGDLWTYVVSHLGSDGTTRWTSLPFQRPSGLSVDPYDGSCWVADQYNDQIVFLTVSDYPTPTPFWDVPLDQWAAAQIKACVAAKIVSGYPNGGYLPGGAVTRDQMAVYIARALAGGDAKVPSAPASATFPDVPTTYWAFRYVQYAASAGIVTGFPDGSYQPELPVTRDQMAVYIARATATPTGDAGLKGYQPPTAPSFPDVPTGFWAYKYIEYIKGKHVTGGYPDGNYHPELVVTRDQMAVYVARAFGLQ